MSLDDFVRSLHADTPASRPSGWEVDWKDAPLPYKLYRGVPAFPLSPEVPLTLTGPEAPVRTDLTAIGHFLWYVNGLAQLSQIQYGAGSMQTCRRYIPSGGGLYPNEVYIYLKIKDAPAGVYHYDAAHHRLMLLREGDYDAYLAQSLGNRCEVSACFGMVFVSTVFWKNFFKYHNFAYRLQGLDAGVMTGQLLETARRFGYRTAVIYQFLDRPVNHLLGLSDREESVYAAIPLSTESVGTWFNDPRPVASGVTADGLIRRIPEVRHESYMRSRRVKEYPMLIRMNEASMLDSPVSFRRTDAVIRPESRLQAVYLPEAASLSYDMASNCQRRFSPETEFVLEKVTQQDLASLLHEAMASFDYANDLDGLQAEPESRGVSLYGCFYSIEGVPNGAYRYDRTAHALLRLAPGDHRLRLQYGLSLDNINLFQVPICLHVAGDKDHLIPSLGYRGYRIQQMEAGMLVHRLLNAASALGMGGRPLLGFHAGNCDDLYGMLSTGRRSLLQLPIGPHRDRPRLEGGLHG